MVILVCNAFGSGKDKSGRMSVPVCECARFEVATTLHGVTSEDRNYGVGEART